MRCNRCNEDREPSEFYVRKGGKRNPWCKPCYRDWYRERSGGIVRRKCDGCGAEMSVTQRRASEPRVYCSSACKDRDRNAIEKAVRLAAKPKDRTCLVCGKLIAPERRADVVFCSDECMTEGRRQSGRQRIARQKSHFKSQYGITLAERDEMLAAQDTRCAVCRSDEPGKRGWAVDHCHTTNVVRGILCGRCNMALGLLRDDPAIARSAAAYLERSTL